MESLVCEVFGITELTELAQGLNCGAEDVRKLKGIHVAAERIDPPKLSCHDDYPFPFYIIDADLRLPHPFNNLAATGLARG